MNYRPSTVNSIPKIADAESSESAVGQMALLQTYHDTAVVLASAIASKDSFEQFHIQRVQVVCELVATAMGLSAWDIEGVLMGALFHDIGKLGVSDHVLLKPGTLTEQEFDQIRSHAALGASMLVGVTYPWDICAMIRHHHECWDGSGYPGQLNGEDIPIGARIIAVAEVYDALISDRCYRGKWTHSQVVNAISADSGIRFAPDVAKAFMDCEKEIDRALSKLGQTQSVSHSDSNMIAVDAIGRANKELVSMFEIVQSINSSMQTSDILDILASRALKTFPATNCTIYLYDAQTPDLLHAVESVGIGSNLLVSQQLSNISSLEKIGYSLTKPYRGPTVWPGILTDDLALDLAQLRSCMAVPMLEEEVLIGVIAVYSDQPETFTAEDERVLAFVAEKAATAIRGSQDYEQIKESAIRDPLTGLYNSGFLMEHLDNEIKRASRRSDSLYVLGLDLDNFKEINDTLGHGAGDEVLQKVAEILSENVREYDIVARIGGDEFVLVLPQSTPQAAKDIADRLRMMFVDYGKSLKIPHPERVDMSIGIASFPNNGLDAKSLLNAADMFMYADKRSHKAYRAA